jgi:hypothetical protein
MKSRRIITGLLTICATLLSIARPVGAQQQQPHVTPEQVEQAIQKAKKFLYSRQKPDGSFESSIFFQHQGTTNLGGETALAVYALLAAGESYQKEEIKKAIAWLKENSAKAQAQKTVQLTYTVGIRANIWPFLPMDKSVRQAAAFDATLLVEHVQKGNGFFNYPCGSGGASDSSNSQYGVLGLWAIAQLGIFEIPNPVWDKIDKAWRSTQDPSGGWQYGLSVPQGGQGITPQMTAAGLASLFITQDFLRFREGVNCTGNVQNPNIQAALNWFSKRYNPNWGDVYLLYGIERIGVASGYKYFGEHDWYQGSAAQLVRSQAGDGSWPYGHGGPGVGTPFGLLFLVRGRAPVVMNKLQYEIVDERASRRAARRGSKDEEEVVELVTKEGPWNQRSRDAANATRWISRQIERDLNWQIVNLKVDPEELHDAPLLYIAGDDELNFTPEHLEKLRRFVEGGGIILGNADCGKGKFTSSFRALGKKLFPSYEFRPLPPDHPIYVGQQFKMGRGGGRKVEVLGLSNGSRELMLLLPDDPARAWQMYTGGGSKDELFQIITNIFLYAVDKQNLRYKGETYVVKRNDKVQADRTLAVARLEYAGNWNPEPGGWRRLANIMHNQHKLDITVEPVKLGEAKLAINTYQAAHLTGNTVLKLSPAEREEIKNFVEAGGTLIIDALNGDVNFADAVELELKTIFPGSDKELTQPLPLSHPLFNPAGAEIKEVQYRVFASKILLEGLRRPRIRAIKVNDRAAVFFSREDITTGLVGQQVDGILGYTPQSATELMANMLLYAAAHAPAPVDPKDQKEPVAGK